MHNKYIEFKQQRDFSGILSDTFKFIRQEFKPLTKTVFNIAGPAIVVLLLALAFYNYVAGDLFDFDNYGRSSFNDRNFMLTIGAFLFYILAFFVAFTMTINTTLNYIKSYVNNKGEVAIDDVKQNTYKTFWGFFGLTLLKGITLFFALILCGLPVLYAMVPMAVVFSLYVFDSKNTAMDAYSKSFTLVNLDFWLVLGCYLVLVIIWYAASAIFSVPSAIYMLVKTGIFSGEVDPANITNMYRDPLLIFLNLVNGFFQFMLQLIISIGGAFLYFHLNEKQNFTGTYERISNIGNQENNA